MDFLKNTPAKYILLAIVFFGFTLRIVNLTIGFPILYMSADEASYHLSALQILVEKTPFTSSNYGPLGAYVQIPFIILSSLVLFLTDKVNSIKDLELLVATHEGYFLFIPRIISALTGTLTILFVYRLSKLLFVKKEIALFSSLLCALSLNMVFISHQARAMSPAIFAAVCSVYFAVFSVKKQSKFFHFANLSALLAGISFGFHQFGSLIFVLVILITYNGLRLSFYYYLRKMVIPIGLFTILVIIFNYLSLGTRLFSILNPQNTQDTVELLNHGFLSSFSLSSMYNFFEKLFLSDPLIVILFIFFFFSREYPSSLYRSFKIFVLFNLLLSILVFPGFIRYFLIAFSFFPVFGGPILFNFFSRSKHRFIFLALVIVMVGFNSLYFNILIARKGTFSQMREWVDRNISVSTPVISTHFRNVGYVPVEAATLKIREKKPGYFQRATQLIGNHYVPNSRFIIYADELADDGMSKPDYTKKALSYYSADIIIDSYLEPRNRLLNSSSGLKLELIAHFSPTKGVIYDELLPEAFSDTSFLFPFFVIDRPGPYFDILKIIR